MSIENTLERIATALEKIAESFSTQGALPLMEQGEVGPDREAIITELKALGVKVAGKQSMKYLTLLLDKKRAEVKGPVAQQPQPEVVAQAPAEAEAQAASPAEDFAQAEETSTIDMSAMREEMTAKEEKPAKKAKAAKVEKPAAEEPKAQEAPAAKPVSLDEAREKLKAFAAKNGAQKALDVLKEFRADKISDVKAEKLADLVARLG